MLEMATSYGWLKLATVPIPSAHVPDPEPAKVVTTPVLMTSCGRGEGRMYVVGRDKKEVAPSRDSGRGENRSLAIYKAAFIGEQRDA